MDAPEIPGGRFEEHRTQLRAVAYRMLGSLSEADDAVQECWLRYSRSDTSQVRNLAGWLTTVVGRICLDMLRSRTGRAEVPLEGVHVPDPVVAPLTGEEAAVRTEEVGLALLVVLDTLSPAERVAFVLHDTFAVPFDEIAPLLDRTPAATRQLASRARRRVRDAGQGGERPDARRQREVVAAFLAAARGGDFDALVGLLDPQVTLRADTGGAGSRLVRGAVEVATQATAFRSAAMHAVPVLVGGEPGLAAVVGGRAVSVMSFTLVPDGHGPAGAVRELNILADPRRLARLGVAEVLGAAPAERGH
ncbi:sigma-70 family RNA polymerase sigma factor [Streptomyces albus]|uniref:sigma-70 family RNA polymerase sigma factor n=1 Tax=Streptomyces albus TaxID=1888 RepID=UPI003452A06B